MDQTGNRKVTSVFLFQKGLTDWLTECLYSTSVKSQMRLHNYTMMKYTTIKWKSAREYNNIEFSMHFYRVAEWRNYSQWDVQGVHTVVCHECGSNVKVWTLTPAHSGGRVTDGEYIHSEQGHVMASMSSWPPPTNLRAVKMTANTTADNLSTTQGVQLKA